MEARAKGHFLLGVSLTLHAELLSVLCPNAMPYNPPIIPPNTQHFKHLPPSSSWAKAQTANLPHNPLPALEKEVTDPEVPL